MLLKIQEVYGGRLHRSVERCIEAAYMADERLKNEPMIKIPEPTIETPPVPSGLSTLLQRLRK
jgi:hypothetical protein